jgi:hypothetical protein
MEEIFFLGVETLFRTHTIDPHLLPVYDVITLVYYYNYYYYLKLFESGSPSEYRYTLYRNTNTYNLFTTILTKENYVN